MVGYHVSWSSLLRMSCIEIMLFSRIIFENTVCLLVCCTAHELESLNKVGSGVFVDALS